MTLGERCDEIVRLIDETPQECRLLIRFLAQTGLRLGEMIALRWGDVDLESRRVAVTRRLYRGEIDALASMAGIMMGLDQLRET